MKNKGFTLLELLAVIVVLAVIATIATKVISDAIGETRNKLYENQIEMVKKAADLHISKQITGGEEIKPYLFLSDLVTSKTLKTWPNDPKNGGLLSGVIKVTRENDQYVTSYLETNSDSGEVVMIDPTKTLTSIVVEGNLTQTKTELGKNILDSNILANNRNIDITTGLEVASGNRTIPTNYIAVTPNTTYTITRPVVAGNMGARYYDINKAYIGVSPSLNGAVSSVTFTTPANCYYFKFVDEGNTLNPGYQLEVGSSPTAYEPFNPLSPSAYYPSPILGMENASLISHTNNLFDKRTVVLGSYYSSAGGIATEANSSRSTQFIEVDAYQPYAWNGLNKNIIINTYDLNQNHLERKILYTTYTLTFEPNVKYVRISSYSKGYNFSDFVFNKGTEAIAYEDYRGFEIPLPNLYKIDSVADSYDVMTGVYNSKIAVKTLSSSDAWTDAGIVRYSNLGNYAVNAPFAYATHFAYGIYATSSTPINKFSIGGLEGSKNGNFYANLDNDATSFSAYLTNEANKGTPLTVYYQKQTPTISNLTNYSAVVNAVTPTYLYISGPIKGNITVEYQ